MVGGPGPEFQHCPPEGGARDGKEKEWGEGVANRCEWGCCGNYEGSKGPEEEGVSFLSTALELALPFSVSSCLIIH